MLTDDPPLGGSHGSPLFSGDRARTAHFAALDREQQEQAVRRLAATGMGDHTIAAATQLSIEQIRRILGEGREAQER